MENKLLKKMSFSFICSDVSVFTLVGGRTEEAGNGDAEETGADRTVAGGAEKEAGTDPHQHCPGQQEVVTGG